MSKVMIRIAPACLLLLACSQNLSAQLYDSLMWIPNAPVHAIVKSGNNIYMGGDFDYIGKPTGFGVPLDTLTGLPGIPNFPKVDGPIYAIAPDFHGGWYIGGKFHHIGGIARENFARIKGNGTVYSMNLPTDGPVYALESKGYQYGEPWVYIGGDFHEIGGVQVNNVAQLKTWKQEIYTTWTPNLSGPVYAIKMVGSNVYVGGSFTQVNSNNYQNLVKITTGGTVINTPNQPNGPVYALYNNEKTKSLFVGGGFSYIGTLYRPNIGKIYWVTDSLTPWNPALNGAVHAISGEQPTVPGGNIPPVDNGRYSDHTLSAASNTIYVGGVFTYVNGNPEPYLVEMSVTSPVTLPATANFNCNGPVWCIFSVKNRNKIYVGGNFTRAGGSTCKNLTCVDTLGLSTGWQVSVGAKVRALTMGSGMLYVGSESPCMYGNDAGHVASIDATTGVANNWDPRIYGNVSCLALSPTNILYVGGTLDSIQGLTRNNIGAIDLATGNVTSFNPGCNGPIRSICLEGNKLYAGGYFTSFGGQVRSDLASVNVNTGITTTWNPNANGTVNSILMNNGKLYCGGYFSVIGGLNQARLACLDTVGGFAIGSWMPVLNDGVYSIATINNNILAGGWFTTVNGSTRNNLCQVDNSSFSLSSYDPSPNGFVRAVAVSGNYAFVGGDFSSYSGQPRTRFAAFDISTGALQSLSLYFDDAPLTFFKDGNYLYCGGGFVDVQTDVHAYFIRLNTTFLLGAEELSNTVNNLSVYPDPTTGIFNLEGHLEANGTQEYRINVYDHTGKEILNRMEKNSGTFLHQQLDISTAAPGIYFIRITNGTDHYSAKIVKVN